MHKPMKRESGIDGVAGRKAPSNLSRASVTNRNPYTKPHPRAKQGGRAKRSRKL